MSPTNRSFGTRLMPLGSPLKVRPVTPVTGLVPKTALLPEVVAPSVPFVENMALVMGPRNTVTPSHPDMYSSKPEPVLWVCFIWCEASRVTVVVLVGFHVNAAVTPRVRDLSWRRHA